MFLDVGFGDADAELSAASAALLTRRYFHSVEMCGTASFTNIWPNWSYLRWLNASTKVEN